MGGDSSASLSFSSRRQCETTWLHTLCRVDLVVYAPKHLDFEPFLLRKWKSTEKQPFPKKHRIISLTVSVFVGSVKAASNQTECLFTSKWNPLMCHCTLWFYLTVLHSHSQLGVFLLYLFPYIKTAFSGLWLCCFGFTPCFCVQHHEAIKTLKHNGTAAFNSSINVVPSLVM